MATVTQQNLHIHKNPTYAHSIGGMPHGLGLLTTVASLPPKYRSRYLNIKTKSEIPLDLSRKSISPQLESEVPMAANFTEVYTEPCSDTASQASEEIIEELVQQSQMTTDKHTAIATTTTNTTRPASMQQNQEEQQNISEHNKPITPPLTPIKKRKFFETSLEIADINSQENLSKIIKTESIKPKQFSAENTPVKPIKPSDTAPKTGKNQSNNGSVHTKTNRSNKVTRKLKFDEETSSPVSGTIIRPLEDITDGNMQYSNGDIDPKYNIVEITEETKAELAAIKNVIGDYVCKLCRIKFDDAFGLAQHRCACIVLLEYRCPECGKQFNCPANLASHRRWHKPRKDGNMTIIAKSSSQTKKENREQNSQKKSEDNETIHNCPECGKKFKRQAYLKKHQLNHQQKTVNSNNGIIINSHKDTKEDMKEGINNSSTRSTTSTTNSPIYQTVVKEVVYNSQLNRNYDEQDETMSDYSSTSSSQGYGRLQIIETGLTEEENIAAAALTNLRNCASVIQHTTFAH